MARRKKTATVQLKLRFREELRRKLEREARAREVSLNNEIVRRLEGSFDETERMLWRTLTGDSWEIGELLYVIADALRLSELHLRKDDPQHRARVTAEAVKKVTAGYLNRWNISDAQFPERQNMKTADGIAYDSLNRGRYFSGQEQDREE
jgi:hypothetical protein